jgi:hypothetical protein
LDVVDNTTSGSMPAFAAEVAGTNLPLTTVS